MPAYPGELGSLTENKSDDYVYTDKDLKSAIKFTQELLTVNHDVIDVDSFWIILYDGKLFQCTMSQHSFIGGDMFNSAQDAQKAFIAEIDYCLMDRFRYYNRRFTKNEYDEDGKPKEGSLLNLRNNLINGILKRHNVQIVEIPITKKKYEETI